MRLAASLLLTLLALPAGAQQHTRWLATWSTANYAATAAPPRDSIDGVPNYVDRTIRQIVRTTIGGDSVRIRLTNEHGERALIIGAAHIALRDSGATVRSSSDKAITFGGSTTVTLRPGAIVFSDPVDFHVLALTDLAVSLWVKDTIRATTRHPLGLQTNYVSAHGDFTATARWIPDTTIAQWLWLAGVDVVNAKATGVIVTIGNSITDGYASTPTQTVVGRMCSRAACSDRTSRPKRSSMPASRAMVCSDRLPDRVRSPASIAMFLCSPV